MSKKLFSRKKLCSENNVQFNIIDSVFSVPRETSLIEDFQIEEQVDEVTGEPAIKFCDPIVIIFNQERLKQLGTGAIDMLLKQLTPVSSALADLRLQCSDDLLIQMIKSRHLQSLSEIKAWCEYMDSNMSEFQSEFEKFKKSTEIVNSDPISNSSLDSSGSSTNLGV